MKKHVPVEIQSSALQLDTSAILYIHFTSAFRLTLLQAAIEINSTVKKALTPENGEKEKERKLHSLCRIGKRVFFHKIKLKMVPPPTTTSKANFSTIFLFARGSCSDGALMFFFILKLKCRKRFDDLVCTVFLSFSIVPYTHSLAHYMVLHNYTAFNLSLYCRHSSTIV